MTHYPDLVDLAHELTDVARDLNVLTFTQKFFVSGGENGGFRLEVGSDHDALRSIYTDQWAQHIEPVMLGVAGVNDDYETRDEVLTRGRAILAALNAARDAVYQFTA